MAGRTPESLWIRITGDYTNLRILLHRSGHRSIRTVLEINFWWLVTFIEHWRPEFRSGEAAWLYRCLLESQIEFYLSKSTGTRFGIQLLSPTISVIISGSLGCHRRGISAARPVRTQIHAVSLSKLQEPPSDGIWKLSHASWDNFQIIFEQLAFCKNCLVIISQIFVHRWYQVYNSFLFYFHLNIFYLKKSDGSWSGGEEREYTRVKHRFLDDEDGMLFFNKKEFHVKSMNNLLNTTCGSTSQNVGC